MSSLLWLFLKTMKLLCKWDMSHLFTFLMINDRQVTFDHLTVHELFIFQVFSEQMDNEPGNDIGTATYHEQNIIARSNISLLLIISQ